MTQKPFGVKQLNVIGAAGTPTIESAGDLNIGGQQVAITTNTSIAGVITATSFFGDGSGLTGVTGSGSGVVIQEEGSSVGTAGTINFIGAGVTATLSGGIASVEITSSGGSGITTANINADTLNVAGVTTFQGSVNLGELDRLNFYTGSTNIYGNATGLNIEASANNDINIKSNSSGGSSGDVKLRTVQGGRIDLTGTGGVGIYYTDTSLKLATNSTGIDVSGTITANGLDMEDNEKILLGTGNDLEIYHDGSDSIINDAGTGDLKLKRGGYDRLTLTSTGVDVNLSLKIKDDYEIRVGDDNDLRIYEAASDVALWYTGSGVLFIRTDGSFKIDDGTHDLFFARNSAIELNYAGSKKLETTSSGVNVSGIVTATSFSGDGSALTGLPASSIAGINTTGTSYFNEIITTDIKSSGISTFNNVNFDDQITYTASTNRMQFGDDAELRFGDGGDLSIYHTAGDIGMSYNSEGVFFLRSNTNFQIDKNGSKRLYAHSDGAVDLYYNGNKRLETTSVGVALTGTVDTAGLVVSGVSTLGVTSISQLQIAGVTTTSSDIHLNQDNATLRIGANGSGDIRIYHTGTASVYYDNYGTTKFLGGSWDFKNIADNKTAAHFDQDSGQELYFDGSKKFETTTTGVTVTGDASVSGEVTAASYKSNDTTGDGSDVGFAIKYYVTSSGSSAYRFAGPGLVNTTNNPTLYLHRGFTYIFENSTGSSHPFRIQFTNTSIGVTTYLSGSNNGTQVFTIPFDAPSSYEYQCTLHSGMKGTLAIPT